jgi:hypothetical protein
MLERTEPGSADSLDIVEHMMALEEALDLSRLSPGQRERLLHEIESRIVTGEFADGGELFVREVRARIANGEFGDTGDLDDNSLGAMVRKLGPHNPRGQAGAAAKPEEPYFE